MAASSNNKKPASILIVLLVAGGLYGANHFFPDLFSSASSDDQVTVDERKSEGDSSAGRGGSTPPSKDQSRPPKNDGKKDQVKENDLPKDKKPPAIDPGAALIAKSFADEKSDVIVESSGTVVRTLADDNEGSRHQKFIIRLANDHTVLISHNIDLAPRVPLEEGDSVRFAGEYEWNDRGGVVHWTHHDPRGRRDGGWIEHDGKRYE